MTNFNVLQAEVIARLGNRSDIVGRSVTWMNDAYYELLLNPNFSFFELDSRILLATTVLGVGTLDLSNVVQFWHILDLVDTTNFRKLTRSHWQVFDKLSPTQGQPVRYARFGMQIELDPTPNGAYDIHMRYRFRPPEFGPDQSFILEREWDEVLVLLAVTKGWEALYQPDRAMSTRQLMNAALERRQDVSQLEDMDSTTTLAPNMWPILR